MKHVISLQAGVTGVVANSEAELETILNNYTLPALWAVVPHGAYFLLMAEDGGTLVTPEYQAVLNYATGQGFTLPSAGQQQSQNTLLATMIDDGVWDELDVFYNFVTDGNADFAKINWKNPGTFQATSTGTFAPLTGINGAINNSFILNVGVNNYTQNNACVLFDGVPSGDYISDSSLSVTTRVIGSAFSGGFWGVNDGGKSFALLPQNGLSQLKRTTNTSVSLHLNGAPVIADLNNASTGLPNGNLIFNGSPVTMCGAGSSLAGKELALYTAWSAYKASI